MSSGAKLKSSIESKGVIRAMASHSPLSAVLAEEAGFDAIWASGFELSALYGLADASLVSMRDHLDMTRAMVDRVDVPVIADIDTGFGNAINAAHAAHCYERAGVAAVVIEDKTFPKMTSLMPGARQQLVRIEEFQGKISAICDARRCQDFQVIGRTEALVAGQGVDEALIRAKAYAEAGADMVLVHSRQNSSNQIEDFSKRWQSNVPLVVVPTSYPDFNISKARASGNIRIVIYGNHAIRACVAAMQEVFAEVKMTGDAISVESSIATLDEIFRLQGASAVKVREQLFLR